MSNMSLTDLSSILELAREEEEAGTTFRKGAITPDGLIDEDFEKELGSPSHVGLTSIYFLKFKHFFNFYTFH